MYGSDERSMSVYEIFYYYLVTAHMGPIWAHTGPIWVMRDENKSNEKTAIFLRMYFLLQMKSELV